MIRPIFASSIISNLLFALAIITVSGCASNRPDCSGLVEATEIFKCYAMQGDKDAQFQVGLEAFKSGNIIEAVKWLEKSAEPNLGVDQVYMPAVGGQGAGTVLTLPKANQHPGSRDAQLLLVVIYGGLISGMTNGEKAKKYEEMAGIKDGENL